MPNKNFRDSIDNEMSHIKWSKSQEVLSRAQKPVGRARGKRSLVMVAAAALILLTVTALAVTLLFSPRYDAEKAARQALQEKYGFSDQAIAIFYGQPEKTRDGYTVVFNSAGFYPDAVGTYTVTLDKQGKAAIVWQHEGEDLKLYEKLPLLERPYWTASQMEEALSGHIVAKEAEIQAYTKQELENQEGPIAREGQGFTTQEQELIDRLAKAMLEEGFTKESLALFEPEVRKRKNETNVAWLVDYSKVPAAVTSHLVSTDPYEEVNPFGEYLVQMYPDGYHSITWSLSGEKKDPYTRQTWGQAPAYTRDMLPWVAEFVEKYHALVDGMPEGEQDTMFMPIDKAAQHDQLFRDAGFSAQAYPAALPRATDLTQEKALVIAHEVLKKELGVTDDMLKDGRMFVWYNLVDASSDEKDRPTWVFSFHLYGDNMQKEVPLSQQGIRTVVLYADTGEVVKTVFDPYYIGNG